MGEDTHMINEHNEQARQELARDIHALSEKLNVKHQVSLRADGVVHKLKETLGMDTSSSQHDARERSTVVSVVRHHPLATAMLGLGAARLVAGWRAEHSAIDRVSLSQHDTRARLPGSVVAPNLEMSPGIGEGMPGSGAQLEQAVQSNMAVFGVGAFALGAIAAALMPRTRLEKNLRLGEMRLQETEPSPDRVTADAIASAGGNPGRRPNPSIRDREVERQVDEASSRGTGGRSKPT